MLSGNLSLIIFYCLAQNNQSLSDISVEIILKYRYNRVGMVTVIDTIGLSINLLKNDSTNPNWGCYFVTLIRVST